VKAGWRESVTPLLRSPVSRGASINKWYCMQTDTNGQEQIAFSVCVRAVFRLCPYPVVTACQAP